MSKENIMLRPIHYASVSGGKDSLYMLGLILANPDKYPLDVVVNFDLEIDWDVSKRVVDLIQSRCIENGIKFIKIKPRLSWDELQEKYGYPHRVSRWCNNPYKIDCKKQLNQWIKENNCRPIAYIGLCSDEIKRFKYDVGSEDWHIQEMCYPLAEEGINEDTILEWAKSQEIFGDYYKIFRRMGCKGCPLGTMLEWAYFLKKHPEEYELRIKQIKDTEVMVSKKGRKYDFKNLSGDEFDKRIRTKWLPKLEEIYKEMEETRK